ncbi:MAG: TRAP transporter substrate-binding protein DctP [Thermodesulfobacteriota bacterium]
MHINARRFGLVVVLSFILAAAVSPSAGEEKKVWKVGTLTPKGVGWARQFEKIILPVIHTATGNSLDVKVYWGGIMGDDEDIIAKMRAGQLQAAGITGQGAVIACPEFAVMELPFLFRNYEEVDYVRQKLAPEFDQMMRKQGFKLLLWLDQDFDQIYSVKWRFQDMEDFKKAKIMTWYGPLEEQLLKSLGASPIPVDIPELVPSLKQGVADTLIAPGLWMIATQLYPAVKYMVPVKLRYSPAIVLCTLDSWNQLSEESRQGLIDSSSDVSRRFLEATRSDNEKALVALEKYGIEKIELDPATVENIRQAAVKIWDEQAGQLYPRDLLDRVLVILDEFRGQKR